MLIVRGVNVFPSRDPRGRRRRSRRPSAAASLSGRAARGRQAGAAAPGRGRARARRRRRRRARRRRSGAAARRADRPDRIELVPWGSLRAASTSPNSSSARVRACASSRPRACTTSRSSAPTARPRSTSGKACSGCRSSSSSRTSTTPSESHLYFDPGDGRLITVFTNEDRVPDPARTATDPGCVHHVAFTLSQATFKQAVERLDERGIRHSGVKDRGFMDSIYFEDPLGLLIELASYRFEPPPRLHARRGAAGGAQAPRRARRLQHRRGASRRRDRARSSQRSRESLSTTARPRTPT